MVRVCGVGDAEDRGRMIDRVEDGGWRDFVFVGVLDFFSRLRVGRLEVEEGVHC